MLFRRILLGMTALPLLMSSAALAQYPYEHQTQVQFQYHELVPSGGDTTPVFLKIFDRISEDCALVGKAFHKTCTIRQINIYTNANYGGNMAGTKMINATASFILGSGSSASAPRSSAGPMRAPSSAAHLSPSPAK